ncbi:uncharacterized protein LOC130636899 [Hydractinia symbiolongicarpus]|uniref:uncharacterized protein LOC130636899 n=1 Tax=Hydractinia symbiolongicarpus TaxID=13093 RepID=UPI00254A2498|nr:uncharacterized protein LOC130636899 [Hydractinia symbiolongicarpus]
MAKALSNIPCVKPFIIEKTSVNLDKKWIVWKDDLELFLTARGITQEAQKKVLILHLKAGTDTYADVIQKLDTYFKPKKNITYERYLFKQTKPKDGESSVNYVTRLKRLGESCQYADLNTEIKDHFIHTCTSSSLQKKLLREDTLTLEI